MLDNFERRKKKITPKFLSQVTRALNFYKISLIILFSSSSVSNFFFSSEMGYKQKKVYISKDIQSCQCIWSKALKSLAEQAEIDGAKFAKSNYRSLLNEQ